MIVVKRLTKRFGGLLANDELSFEVTRGEIVAVIGPNGAGKSTLFNCLTGQLRPSAGEVLFEGRSTVGMAPEQVAALGVARTFQVPGSFGAMSVLDNAIVGALLRRPKLAEARAFALEVLDRVGLADRAEMPARQLNVAGQKRLELARAMATQPRLLLLDEVAGGLNAMEAHALADVLTRIHAGGVTLVLVEHVLEVVMKLAQRVLVIDFGRLIASGPPQAIVQEPRVIEAYLGKDYGEAAHA